MNKLGTVPNLGITEHNGPCNYGQYFMFSDSGGEKMVTIQRKRIIKFLQKEVEKIIHDCLEENNAKK